VSGGVFPFAALVGLDTLKLALQLSAIDSRLSVLVRGDKGAGKSTAARALAELLPAGAPFVNLPIGATEDRLLGGLDIERTLKGAPELKPGLVSQAHGGILYVDEVNLLADHLADALLDTAAGGVLVVEREGFSVSQAAEFVLLGSMNPEEGSLRPQLLDRFALVVDVSAPADPSARAAVLERRLAFDRDRGAFRSAWTQEQTALAQRVGSARERITEVVVSAELLQHIATRISALGVRSLRADLAVVRAARACAALVESDAVTPEHVETVLALALVHRMPPGTRPPSPPVPPSPPRTDTGEPDGSDSPDERVFRPSFQAAPRLVVDRSSNGGGVSAGREGPRIGQAVGSRRTESIPAELDVRASIVHAIGRRGAAELAPADLHERIRQPRNSTRFILVVDSSGSHAVAERMRLVKGVAAGLLDASHGRHDEVVVIGCRGPLAEVVVEPTSSREDADRALEYLPTGGRTPLAHGLELAAGYVTDHALVVVITDGRANVPTRTEDAWADTQTAAAALRCAGLVVDTEDSRTATGRPKQLADAMQAQYARIDTLDASHVLTIVRSTP
jgi:magnesium chelatase subunit D